MKRVMKEKGVWVEKFRVSEANLEKWRKEAGPKEDLLRWCLLNGKINESEYLGWACEYYELPVVEAQFFSLPADIDFFDNVRDVAAWKADLFPLHEWQGVLLVACVAPPKDVAFDRPHRFVLASPRALNMLWSALNYNREITAGPPTPAAAPVPAIAAEPPVTIPIIEAAVPETAPTDAPSTETPEGFMPDPSADDIKIDLPSSLTAEAAPEGISNLVQLPPAPSSGDGAPIGLGSASIDFSSLNFDVSTQLPPPVEPRDPDPASSLLVSLPALERPTGKITPPPADVIEITQPRMAAPPPVGTTTAIPVLVPKVAEKEPVEEKSVVSHKVKESTSTRSMDLNYGGGGRTSAKPRAGLTGFDQCVSYEDVAEVAFQKMQPIFQKAIMFIFQSGQLRPWKWSGNIAYNGKSKPNAIDLTPPSMFRIVFNTCLPYHGYIVPNAANNAFFAELNGGINPKHVTLMPVMVNGQIAGMLMGATDGEINMKNSLRQMESLITSVNQAFTRVRSKKAA